MKLRMKYLAFPMFATAMALTACGDTATDTPEGEPTEQIAEGPGTAIDVLAGNEDFSTLTAALESAGLTETLTGTGPFTILAPNNAAFDKLEDGTVDDLLKPENQAKLTGLLTYHIIPGKVDAAALAKMIADGGGSAEIGTVSGGKLITRMDGEDIVLTDEAGGLSKITSVDVETSNGTIHVIDSVAMPAAE
ncbi:MAG: fasciclin domain-containing protein [Altererythrobacter sp.]